MSYAIPNDGGVDRLSGQNRELFRQLRGVLIAKRAEFQQSFWGIALKMFEYCAKILVPLRVKLLEC